MHEGAIIGKEEEDWWLNLGLNGVVEAEVCTLLNGHGGLIEHGLAQEGVEFTGRHTLLTLILDLASKLNDLPSTLTFKGRDEHNRCVVDKLEGLAHLCLKGVVGLVIFRDCIPLIDQNGDPLLRLEDHAGNVGILGGHALRGVDEQHGHITALDGAEGTQYGVLLDTLLDTTRTTDPSSIDQGHWFAMDRNRGINGIAGSSRQTRDHRTLGAKQSVQQARLPHVRPPDDGDTEVLLLLGTLVPSGEDGDKAIEHVTGTDTVECAHRNGIA